jgi:hypothetical protein
MKELRAQPELNIVDLQQPDGQVEVDMVLHSQPSLVDNDQNCELSTGLHTQTEEHQLLSAVSQNPTALRSESQPQQQVEQRGIGSVSIECLPKGNATAALRPAKKLFRGEFLRVSSPDLVEIYIKTALRFGRNLTFFIYSFYIVIFAVFQT